MEVVLLTVSRPTLPPVRVRDDVHERRGPGRDSRPTKTSGLNELDGGYAATVTVATCFRHAQVLEPQPELHPARTRCVRLPPAQHSRRPPPTDPTGAGRLTRSRPDAPGAWCGRRHAWPGHRAALGPRRLGPRR